MSASQGDVRSRAPGSQGASETGSGAQPGTNAPKWWQPTNYQGVGAGFCTLVVFVILIIWIVILAAHVGTAPRLVKGTSTIFDEFANLKDILLAILPLATTSLGYWYGNQQSNSAKDAATAATEEAAKAKSQLSAVLDQAPEGTLTRAKAAHAEAFE